MDVTTLVMGVLDTNCYIISMGKDAIIIDPAVASDNLKNTLQNKNIVAVLITHNHYDHIGAVEYIRTLEIPIYNYYNLTEGETNLGSFKFEVIYTPGHSEDSVSYFFPSINSLFSGDFIFKNTLGRCDLPTGSVSDMSSSIKKIKDLPPNVIIYPGHGDKTTMEEEKTNLYFK